MAALLRSARLLKSKPVCLLQNAGVKTTGGALSQLYSGATGGRKLGVCSRQLFSAADNAPRRLLPSTSAFIRNYAVAIEQTESSSKVQSKQAKQFDWALGKLDYSVKRTGRITKELLLHVFDVICRTECPCGSQALLCLRSCGLLLPEVLPAERTELAHHIWEKFQKLGVQYDVSHYNALLKVYLQNEFKFSPLDILAKMEAANVLPNRVTYQRCIANYCQNGDIDGASTILGIMKNKGLPITEMVFNSLVTGHACAGDIESARNILTVMHNAGIEPGPDTYVSLLNAYAQNGDMENMKATLEAAQSADCSLTNRDFKQVIFTLAKAGHQQHVPEMIERVRFDKGFIPDAMNLCLNLITHGLEDAAFNVLMRFSTLQSNRLSEEPRTIGRFFLRHCVKMETPSEKIGQYCKKLQEANMQTAPLTFALYCALGTNKSSLSFGMMKVMKDQGMPIRPHFFWPLLAAHVKDKNTAATMEILNAMDSLDVCPDPWTLADYVIPAFPSPEDAENCLKDFRMLSRSDGDLVAKARALALVNLTSLYAFLSDKSYPTPDLSSYRIQLIKGFMMSSDVETMTKITELLFKNKDMSDKPSEQGAYFLYGLIDAMTPHNIQEEKLRQYFTQLKEKNITISANIYRGIKNLLNDHKVPELVEDIFALVDPIKQDTTDLSISENKLLSMVEQLEQLKSENKPVTILLKRIFQFETNLGRALELKQQHKEDMTIEAYAVLIRLCCRKNNSEEALNLKREMSQLDSSAVLSVSKYMDLVKALCDNNKVEEAVDILKEMKEKDLVLGDFEISLLSRTLKSLGTNGYTDSIRRLQNTIFTLGLANPTFSLCSPLVSAYMMSNDLHRAVDAGIECQKLYKRFPQMHEVLVALVKLGDTEQIQKVMDSVNEEYGEMLMMYDLFFAFLETGRYREARKIIETPGLRAKPGRLRWFAERCISLNEMEPLEQMVDMTLNLFDCDRDEMYFFILKLCRDKNDWQKAETMWTKMQEENMIPKERTLRLLASILKSNGQVVPFEVPETGFEPASVPADSPPKHMVPRNLRTLCEKGKVQEAYELLKDLVEKKVSLSSATYDHVICSLLRTGALEDAMVVKDMAEAEINSFKLSKYATSLLIITQSLLGKVDDALLNLKSMCQAKIRLLNLPIVRLVHAFAKQGNLAGIQEVDALMKKLDSPPFLNNMLFINCSAVAHIHNGDLEAAVEIMESVYSNPNTPPSQMSFVFKKILEDGNDEAFDKVSATAERLANHFASYGAAVDIFLSLLDMGKVDDAKFMLARCNAIAEQRDRLRWYLVRSSRTPGELRKIKNLLDLIPDFVDRKTQYTLLMKCHALDKDLDSAKALHERMQKEGVEVNELTLKRLALLYQQAGEVVPFPEPPESFWFYANKLRRTTPEIEE